MCTISVLMTRLFPDDNDRFVWISRKARFYPRKTPKLFDKMEEFIFTFGFWFRTIQELF